MKLSLFAIAGLLGCATLLASAAQDDCAKPSYCIRGEAKLLEGSLSVQLPEWFETGALPLGRTVILTCKDGWSPLSCTGVVAGKFTVSTTAAGSAAQKFFWVVQAYQKN